MRVSDMLLATPMRDEAVMITPSIKTIKLFLAEEQQILRTAYQSFFVSHPHILVVGATGDTSPETLVPAIMTAKPTILLLGLRTLQSTAVEKLEAIRESAPDLGIILLSASYDLKGIKALRAFSRGSGNGCAYLLKHTIDTVEQLTQVIYSVQEGRIILDPAVMDHLLSAGEPYGTFLKELSPRELEVLSWMAKGYRNNTIAEILCLEAKTVERHINNIYSKLGNLPESKHARVHAITLYLRATGQLPAEESHEG